MTEHVEHAEPGERSHGEPSTAYLPTPDEIAAACRELQAGWSDEERWSRATGRRHARRWFPPGMAQYSERFEARMME